MKEYQKLLAFIAALVFVVFVGIIGYAILTTNSSNRTAVPASTTATVAAQPTQGPTQTPRLEPTQMIATAQQPTATMLQPTATAQQLTPNSVVPPSDEPPILYISADVQAVNVRSCPGADCPRVDCLAVGSEISIVDIGQATDGSTWYGFTYTGGAAWVNAALTSPELPEDNSEKPQGCTMVLATSPPPAPPTQRPPTQRPAPPPVVGSCTCTGPDLDCADFSTHNEAQACHNKCMAERGFDVYRLDGDDNDGLACERLP